MLNSSIRLESVTFLVVVMACAEGTAPVVFRPENIERGDAGSMQVAIGDATLGSWSVSALREDGLLVIRGTHSPDGYEEFFDITLKLRTDVGYARQFIETGNAISAELKFRLWDFTPMVWSAYQDRGSGTFSLTEITARRLAGTFEFEALQTDTTSTSAIIRVRGSFNVPRL